MAFPPFIVFFGKNHTKMSTGMGLGSGTFNTQDKTWDNEASKQKAHLRDIHFGHGTLKFWNAGQLFWARPAWFIRQNMFESFQCWFLERHPWNKNGTLKFLSPCTYMTAVHVWFQARFRHVRRAFAGCSKKKKNIADSRVQKAIVWLVSLKKWKRLSQLWDETRSSLACTAPYMH